MAGPITCGKRRFRDRIAAELALARIDDPRSEKIPRSSYACPQCRGWHLTSQSASQ